MFGFLLVDIHIETKNGSQKFGSNCGMNITGQTSIKFQIKSCNDVSLLLGNSGNENSDRPFYTIIVGTEFFQIQSPPSPNSNDSWLGLNCSYYVDLWIFWSTSYLTFKAGTGTNIGDSLIREYQGSYMNEFINYVEVASTYQAYWNLDLPANSKNGKYKYYMRKRH